MLRKQRKKRTIVVDHVVLYRCFTVVSGGQKLNNMYSGTVSVVVVVLSYCCLFQLGTTR